MKMMDALFLSFKQIDIMTAFLDLALFFFFNGSFLAYISLSLSLLIRRERLAGEKEWNENDGCLVPLLGWPFQFHPNGGNRDDIL
jgi:hypothetical protein